MKAIDIRYDCDDDPLQLTPATALRILAEHAHNAWEPCLVRLAALAFLSEEDG